ncbi:MAG: MIP/aquaporin family protein [Fimbriimonas sp.]
MRPFIEFLGTFLFLFVIALVAGGSFVLAPVAMGGALMVLVYVGRHLSSGQFNPAVSLVLVLRGKQTFPEFLVLMAAQVLGGLAAFAVGYFVTGRTPGMAPGPDASLLQALVVEMVFTYMLCLVVLSVTTHRKTAENPLYGLAIGSTFMVAIIAGGPISGGGFNPATGLAATVLRALVGSGSFEYLWIYIVGPIVGSILAAFTFKAIAPDAESE